MDNRGRQGFGKSDDEIVWYPYVCFRTTRLNVLVGSLVTIRDGGSTERIGGGGEALLWDRPSTAIGGRRACPTRPKGEAYSVCGGGGGGGKGGSWCRF